MNRNYRAIAALACMVLGAAPLALADDDASVSSVRRAAILLRAVAYERTITQKPGNVTLAIVGAGSGASNNDARAMELAFRAVAEKFKLAGRSINLVRVVHSSEKQTVSDLRRLQAEIVYLASGLEATVAAACSSLINEQRIVLCADPSWVGKGCLLAVGESNGKPEILIDLAGARQTGLSFDARLLRAARDVSRAN